MRAKGKIRKLRGMLKGTDALQSLMAERARECAKEDAALDPGFKPTTERGGTAKIGASHERSQDG